jgi:competence protein ComEC
MDTSYKAAIIFSLMILLALNLIVWFFILTENKLVEMNFLDVGQGDATLLKFPNSGKFLIDAGPNRSILNQLGDSLGFFDKKIDVLILSHANLDHYGGFFEILEKYQPKVFVYNGADSNSEIFKNLITLIKNRGIIIVVLKSGDKIKIGNNNMNILSPEDNIVFSEKNLNDSSLIIKLEINGFKTLFLGDAGYSFLDKLEKDWQADILKISHHGSKNGTNTDLLALIKPQIALIGVGLNNSYHHPADIVMDLLKDFGVKIFRTDQNGSISIKFGEELIIRD